MFPHLPQVFASNPLDPLLWAIDTSRNEVQWQWDQFLGMQSQHDETWPPLWLWSCLMCSHRGWPFCPGVEIKNYHCKTIMTINSFSPWSPWAVGLLWGGWHSASATCCPNPAVEKNSVHVSSCFSTICSMASSESSDFSAHSSSRVRSTVSFWSPSTWSKWMQHQMTKWVRASSQVSPLPSYQLSFQHRWMASVVFHHFVFSMMECFSNLVSPRAIMIVAGCGLLNDRLIWFKEQVGIAGWFDLIVPHLLGFFWILPWGWNAKGFPSFLLLERGVKDLICFMILKERWCQSFSR